MLFELTCSVCDQPLRAAEQDAGKKARCPACKSTFVVPEASELETAAEVCHFCGEALSGADRDRFAAEFEAFQQRQPSRPASFDEQPGIAHLLPADRFGVYPTCDACHGSAVQNREEIREEQEAMGRQRWGWLFALITVVLLAIVASLAAYLRHHARTGALPTPRSESAHQTGIYCPRTAMRIA